MKNTRLNSCSSSPIDPIICLAHRFEAIGNKYIYKPMGFSPISMQILQILNKKSPITASDLLLMTNSTKSNMSQRLSFLEKDGYIEKARLNGEVDKRKILISITPIGKKRISDIEKRIQKAQISFEKKFTEKELSEHKCFLTKLNKILDEGENELEKIFKF